MVWDENLNKIENEIKVLKKQKSIAKSSKIKKEKIEKTKEV